MRSSKIFNLDPRTSEERVCMLIQSEFRQEAIKSSKLFLADLDLETLEYVFFSLLFRNEPRSNVGLKSFWIGMRGHRKLMFVRTRDKKNLRTTGARI